MSTTLLFRHFATVLLATLLTADSFRAEAQVVQIDTGTPSTPLYAVGPIYMSSTLYYRYSRFAYLYTEAELAAVGIQAGTDILTVGWMKSTPNSTAGPASFRILMKNSSTSAYSDPSATWTNLSSGTTLVYASTAQAIPATASPQYIDFALSAPFTYAGGSLEILTEWDISAASAPIATGAFEWENTIVADRIYASGNTSLPATLSSTQNNTNITDRRPVIQFTIDDFTGIQAREEALTRLFPNPAEGFVQISHAGDASIQEVLITNALGQVVHVENPVTSATDLRIDLGQLAAGTYQIRLQTTSARVVKKLIVL